MWVAMRSPPNDAHVPTDVGRDAFAPNDAHVPTDVGRDAFAPNDAHVPTDVGRDAFANDTLIPLSEFVDASEIP